MDAVVDGFGSGKMDLVISGNWGREFDGERGSFFPGKPPELGVAAPESGPKGAHALRYCGAIGFENF